MSAVNAATFACEACGKKYRWKDQFAGKKLKCACGNIMQPAALAAVPAPAAEAGCPECGATTAAGAAICINCGTDLRTGMKVQTKVLAGAPKTAKKKKTPPKGPGMGKGEFTSFAQRRILADDPEEIAAKAKWNDIYWPTIMLAVGFVLSIVDATWGQGASGFKYAVMYVMLISVIDVIFSFIGVLITSKLFSIGLGSFQMALLKVSAIALAPGAIDSIISSKFASGWVIGWIASVGLYFVMFNKFFDMDMGETFVCSAIIFVMRTWVAYFLVMMILGGLGLSRFGGGGGFGSDDDETPSKQVKPKKKPAPATTQPEDTDDDEEVMAFPIGNGARVVFT